MTQLVATVRKLGLDAEVGPSGRWIRLQGTQRMVYVLKALWSDDYYMWCEPPFAAATEIFRDPLKAVEAGLSRAGTWAGC